MWAIVRGFRPHDSIIGRLFPAFVARGFVVVAGHDVNVRFGRSVVKRIGRRFQFLGPIILPCR